MTTNGDSLGDRMKGFESRYRHTLERKVPVIVRVDGRAFHTWTRGCTRPFDPQLVDAMLVATHQLADSIQGCRLAYVQSDEASFLLTDWDRPESQPWFGYDLAKVVSLAASGMTAYFNRRVVLHGVGDWAIGTAQFDARAFNIPLDDVANYFLWRAKDWRRNSIQMLAQAHFSPKQLHGKKLDELLAMLEDIGEPWRELPPHLKHGQFYLPKTRDCLSDVYDCYAAVSEVVSKCMPPTTEKPNGQ